jgi:hypothetical protein
MPPTHHPHPFLLHLLCGCVYVCVVYVCMHMHAHTHTLACACRHTQKASLTHYRTFSPFLSAGSLSSLSMSLSPLRGVINIYIYIYIFIYINVHACMSQNMSMWLGWVYEGVEGLLLRLFTLDDSSFHPTLLFFLSIAYYTQYAYHT